jgi:hypothetical protein
MGGDPVRSDQLRDPFLRWMGNRTNATGLRLAGVDYPHGMRWLAGNGVLADRFQVKVRALLERESLEVLACT